MIEMLIIVCMVIFFVVFLYSIILIYIRARYNAIKWILIDANDQREIFILHSIVPINHNDAMRKKDRDGIDLVPKDSFLGHFKDFNIEDYGFQESKHLYMISMVEETFASTIYGGEPSFYRALISHLVPKVEMLVLLPEKWESFVHEIDVEMRVKWIFNVRIEDLLHLSLNAIENPFKHPIDEFTLFEPKNDKMNGA